MLSLNTGLVCKSALKLEFNADYLIKEKLEYLIKAGHSSKRRTLSFDNEKKENNC
jgi:hypothetical protein